MHYLLVVLSILSVNAIGLDEAIQIRIGIERCDMRVSRTYAFLNLI